VKKTSLILMLLLSAVVAVRILLPVQSPRVEMPGKALASHEDADDILFALDALPGLSSPEVPAEIVNRPVFFKERKPPSDEPPKPVAKKESDTPKPKGGKLKVSLKGVVGVGTERFALVSFGKKEKTRQLKKGEEVDGWRLDAIHHDKLVFVRGGEKQEVLLRSYKPYVPYKKPPTAPKPPNKLTVKKKEKRPPVVGKRILSKRSSSSRKRQKAVTRPADEP